jgi:hypothetical protein
MRADALPLGPTEEAAQALRLTRTPPAGWSIDDTGMPGFGTPEYPANDGRTEWAGWAFADVKWWPTVDNQRRAEFLLASGAAAIADPDEWDDATHLKGLFNSYLSTPEIDVTGKAANSLIITFDCRGGRSADDPGASFPDGRERGGDQQPDGGDHGADNGAPVEVMRWDSMDSPTTRRIVSSSTKRRWWC